MKLVSEIGHGMHNRKKGAFDPGADPKGAPQEHTDVERIGERLALEMRSRNHKVKVIEDVPLSQRVALATAFEAKLVASNHLNSGGGTGVEVLVNKKASKRLKRTAKAICAVVSKELGIKNRGIKYRDDLAMLKGAHDDMLIEWYFVDSASDRKAASKHITRAIVAVADVIEREYGTAGHLKYPGYVLKMGAKGAYVLWVKRQLKKLGYDGFDVNSPVFGKGTYAAVKRCRLDNFKGRPQTGNVGPNTWVVLQAAK